MKKLMFGLAALCLAFGLVFSMSAFKVKRPVTAQWFVLDEFTGDRVLPLQTIDPEAACDLSGTKYCAGEYYVDGENIGEPTGEPIRMKH